MCFTEFLRERQYLLNVSTATLDWYKNAFKWLPSASPSQADLKDVVMRMRQGAEAHGLQLIYLRD